MARLRFQIAMKCYLKWRQVEKTRKKKKKKRNAD